MGVSLCANLCPPAPPQSACGVTLKLPFDVHRGASRILACEEVLQMVQMATEAKELNGTAVDAPRKRLLEDYFSQPELARELDVASKTLCRWDRDGIGP